MMVIDTYIQQRNKLLRVHRVFSNKKLILTFILIVFGLLYLFAINSDLYLWGDNAHYIIIAKSIITGQALTDIHLPHKPPFNYPIPFFPVLLSPLVYIFDYNLYPLKVLITLFGIINLYLVYRLYKEQLNAKLLFLLVFYIGTSPQMISFSHQVMSEIPYLALSIISVLLLTKYTQEHKWLTFNGFLSAFVIALTLLTKTLGILILMSFVAHLVLDVKNNRLQNALKILFLGTTTIIIWLVCNYSIIIEIPYIKEFFLKSPYSQTSNTSQVDTVGLLARIMNNVNGYIKIFPEVILYFTYNFFTTLPHTLLRYGCLFVLAYGYIYSIAKRRTIVDYYIFLYILILLLYNPSNYGNMQRYVIPIIPFICYYVIQGVYQILLILAKLAQKIFSKFQYVSTTKMAENLTIVSLLALISWNFAFTFQISILRMKPEMFDYYALNHYKGYRSIALWTKDHTPSQSIILTNSLHLYHFWSRRLVNYVPEIPLHATKEQVIQSILATKANYITIGTQESMLIPGQPDLRTIVQQTPGIFELVYESEGNLLYRIH